MKQFQPVQTEKTLFLVHMKHGKIVYNADGVEFSIYETNKSIKSGPTKYWLLEDYSTGKRRLLNNQSEKAAKRRVDKIRPSMAKGQANRMALTHGQWQEVCMALEVVRSHGSRESLGSAIRSWSESAAILGGRTTLFDAAKFYLSNHTGDAPPLKHTRFADAATIYHTFKLKSGNSDSHCSNIKCRLDRLVKVLPAGVLLDELTAGQFESAASQLGIGGKTCNEYRLVLSNLYKWAAKQNPPLVSKDFNPANEMDRRKVQHQEVEYLRVADLKKMLAGVQAERPDLLLLMVLVCFAGLRPSEAVRIDWAEIGVDYIRLPGKKSKTGYSRQISIPNNLKK